MCFYLLGYLQASHIMILFKDTMKTYFCYRHTLLQTMTLSRLFQGITFLWPTAPGPDPRPSASTPGSIYLFTAPVQIIFSRRLTMELLFTAPNIKNYVFMAPSNNNNVSCLFFTPLNKTQATAYSKIHFRKMLDHTPINCSVNLLAVFI